MIVTRKSGQKAAQAGAEAMARDRIHVDGNCCGPRQKVPDRTVPLRFATAIRITGPAA
jgi:hypothetical protein